MGQKKKKSVHSINVPDTVTIIVFLIVVFSFAVLFFLIPDKKISEEENRSLQQSPQFSLERLISGKFTGDTAAYYSDQFPFRNALIGVKAAFSYAFLINENKGAVISKDGYIIQRYDIYDDYDTDFDLNFSFDEAMRYVKTNCEHINVFKSNLTELGKNDLTVAIVPRKIDVMTNKLPKFFPVERNQAYYDVLKQNIDAEIYADLLSVLLPKNSEYIYYRTDHHWTTAGVFYAYSFLGEKLGYEPYVQGDFTIEKAADDFYGTTWSKSGARWIQPDDIYYYHLTKEYGRRFYTTNINQSREIQGFYDLNYLNTKDKYASFIGGINAHTSIYFSNETFVTDEAGDSYFGEPREKLLLITDSFGQSMAPFLAMHYDIEVVDMRFYNEKAQSIYDFIIENRISRILVMVGMESISNQNNLVKLRSK